MSIQDQKTINLLGDMFDVMGDIAKDNAGFKSRLKKITEQSKKLAEQGKKLQNTQKGLAAREKETVNSRKQLDTAAEEFDETISAFLEKERKCKVSCDNNATQAFSLSERAKVVSSREATVAAEEKVLQKAQKVLAKKQNEAKAAIAKAERMEQQYQQKMASFKAVADS